MRILFQDYAPSGFRLDSPVKLPVASETPRCAPPHTFRAGEEPCGGGVGGLPRISRRRNPDPACEQGRRERGVTAGRTEYVVGSMRRPPESVGPLV